MRSAGAEADKAGLPPRVPAGAVPRYLLSEESVAGVPAVPLPREGGQACAVPHAHGRHRRACSIAVPVCPLPFFGPTASRREVPGQHGPAVVLLVRQCQGKLGWGWGCVLL